MATPNRRTIADLRGATRLAIDATLGVMGVVEKMHHTVQLTPMPIGKSRAARPAGLTGLIYRSIRGTTRLIGHGLDAGLAPVAALLPDGETSAGRDAWVSVINGVYGDHLEATGNPLAIEMSFRSNGVVVDPGRPAEALSGAQGRVMLVIHGLCLNDLHWSREGVNRMEAVAAASGYTPIFLRYNTGRSIATNGRQLASMLETLLGNWPGSVDELAIAGHSMGGLVARSASHHGEAAGHAWVRALRKLVFLGTPHHGAPLERGGHRLDYVMQLSPYVAPFATLGKARSAGITDLRYGTITEHKKRAVPLPAGVSSYTVAATLGKRRTVVAERLIGDGLVPLDSALGRHDDANRTLAIPKSHQHVIHETGHLELLHRPEVYERVSKWLE